MCRPDRYSVILLLCLLMFAQRGFSVEQVDLYRVVVDIQAKTAKERDKAARKGLQQVFIRVSGDPQVLENHPSLKSKLNSARRILSSFEYVTLTAPKRLPADDTFGDASRPVAPAQVSQVEVTDRLNTENQDSGPQNEGVEESDAIVLKFQESDVRRMLESAGAPLWQATRPVTMVWLVAHDRGQLDFVSAEHYPEILLEIAYVAEQRGLPVVFPELDLAELIAVSPQDIWEGNADVILSAADRYQADEIYLARLSQSAGRVSGQWQKLLTDASSWQIESASLREFANRGVNAIATDLAQRFAVKPAYSGNNHFLRSVTIENIRSEKDYHAVMAQLEGIDALQNLQLKKIEAQSLVFHFNFSGDISTLDSLLALRGNLNSTRGSGELIYQWQALP